MLYDIKIDHNDRNNVALAKNCFNDTDLKNKEKILEIGIGSLKTRYKNFIFTTETSDDLPNYMFILVPLATFKIDFATFPVISYEVDRGDLLIFPQDTMFNIFNKDKRNDLIECHKIYYYPKIQKTNGKNKYIIRATLEDHYNIEIYADTQDEAMQKAYNIPLPEWNHEEIDDHKEKIKIVRWSKWGNFKVVEK